MCVAVCAERCVFGKMRMIGLRVLRCMYCSVCCSMRSSVFRSVFCWQNENDWATGAAMCVLQCVLHCVLQRALQYVCCSVCCSVFFGQNEDDWVAGDAH